MEAKLEPQWKDYLALPGELFAEGRTAPKEVFDKCASRYNAVATDARYQGLRPVVWEDGGSDAPSYPLPAFFAGAFTQATANPFVNLCKDR